ncbi:unnamed protein product [Citrullus colocynthis]|uniref:Uncharacterized protein n=1 Tax=Citrullus colocynthis TaxID=252529 RepID=A0ABP0YU70_9ROSI
MAGSLAFVARGKQSELGAGQDLFAGCSSGGEENLGIGALFFVPVSMNEIREVDKDFDYLQEFFNKVKQKIASSNGYGDLLST